MSEPVAWRYSVQPQVLGPCEWVASTTKDIPDAEPLFTADTIAALLDEVSSLTDVLYRNGFVRCDIAACNCGSWHARYGLRERFEEIKDALSEATDLNGKTVLSALNEVITERDALAREVDACAAALPGPYYMDPPDGGDVSISEQLRRMARDAARYRWLRQPNPLHREAHIAVLTHNGGWVASGERADAAIDAAMKGAGDE